MLSDGNPLLESQIELWRKKIRPNLEEALELVPDDKLDWAPGENMINLGQVFLHISECSDWWYDDVVKGKPAIELALPGQPCPPKQKIAEHMQAHWERMERFFADSPDILNIIYERQAEHDHFALSGYWIFSHLLEHDIHHRSQIHHYLRILGIQPPRL